jgi:hypothetical protein
MIYNSASHIDSTTLADGNYQLIPEQEEVYSEDPGTLVTDFSEAPNQGSEENILTNPNPTSEGKPRTYPLPYYTATYITYIYISLCIRFLGVVWKLSCITLGTNVMNTRTGVRLAALLIRPVEVE